MPATWQSQEVAVEEISLLPQKLDLKIYAGDGVRFRLVVTDSIGRPIPLTGELFAQIRVSRKDPTILASFTTAITDEAQGEGLITLTGEETASLNGIPATGPDDPVDVFTGVWDVQWSPSGDEPVTLYSGDVESRLDVTRN